MEKEFYKFKVTNAELRAMSAGLGNLESMMDSYDPETSDECGTAISSFNSSIQRSLININELCRSKKNGYKTLLMSKVELLSIYEGIKTLYAEVGTVDSEFNNSCGNAMKAFTSAVKRNSKEIIKLNQ